MSNALDRTTPYSKEAEQVLLGALLVNPKALLDVAGLVSAADFFRDGHQRIFRAILALEGRKVTADLVTVKEYLTVNGEIDQVDGPAYIASLTDGVPSSSHAVHYAGIVRQKAMLRSAIVAANELLEDAYTADDEAESVIGRAEQKLFALSQHRDQGGFKKLGAILADGVFEQIEKWQASKGKPTGIPSGITDLDDLTLGFQDTDLIIVAARPGVGKSAFVLNVAQHVARLGIPVGIFSLEMSELQLAIRALTAEAGVHGSRLRAGCLSDRELVRIGAAFGTLSDLPIYIDETFDVSPFLMRSRARRLKAEHGLRLLIVDYTQLVGSDDDRNERQQGNRALELARITRAMKGLAKELRIPLITLSQLSRKGEDEERPPRLSDLRESGALEQDADMVIFIHRPPNVKDMAEFIVGKQRNGEVGTAKVAWIAGETRFANLSEAAGAYLPEMR